MTSSHSELISVFLLDFDRILFIEFYVAKPAQLIVGLALSNCKLNRCRNNIS